MLAAHGPIETLLNGGQGILYQMDVQGDIERAQTIARKQAWVSNVEMRVQGSATQMLVTVTDEKSAQAQLLRLLMADENLIVTNYGRKKYELEEIFLNIVEGEENGSK